jgi:hypothetical protein
VGAWLAAMCSPSATLTRSRLHRVVEGLLSLVNAMRFFLDTPDAAQVLELMREAEVTALELTESVQWPGEGWVSLMLLMPPVRLVIKRQTDLDHDFLAADFPLPDGVAKELRGMLQRDALWRRVRRELDLKLKTA